jgi:hypothetical protein
MAGSCEHSNETSGFITGEELPNLLSDYQVLMKESTTWRNEFVQDIWMLYH